MSAVSHRPWGPGTPAILFVNSRMPADRARFSLAHELGHLVMHECPLGDVEREADRFAAELLMPAREIGPEFPSSISLKTLVPLKARWRISIRALVYRACNLGLISKQRGQVDCMRP